MLSYSDGCRFKHVVVGVLFDLLWVCKPKNHFHKTCAGGHAAENEDQRESVSLSAIS